MHRVPLNGCLTDSPDLAKVEHGKQDLALTQMLFAAMQHDANTEVLHLPKVPYQDRRAWHITHTQTHVGRTAVTQLCLCWACDTVTGSSDLPYGKFSQAIVTTSTVVHCSNLGASMPRRVDMQEQVQCSTVNQTKATTMLLVGSATPFVPLWLFPKSMLMTTVLQQEPHVLLPQADSLPTLA